MKFVLITDIKTKNVIYLNKDDISFIFIEVALSGNKYNIKLKTEGIVIEVSKEDAESLLK
ncbi:hypothetical protein SCORR_v1c10190 (plasmid) [Spiroplasma corruscae]|uniref:Uncharacterized protein n=1 Tax=Spiroplasma corruscae TaxID=216934 RepID=A0A222EQX1_9MOLU|nr:hypothetical protein [Spiroplasma corruscae]ASP28791.1 hypothetical protein SCORR_v1c10190 [Spiroplasma corruscae]